MTKLTKEIAIRLWNEHGANHYQRFKPWYEPEGSETISLLRCTEHFRKFGSEYSVIRGVKRGQSDALRKALAEKTADMNDPCRVPTIAKKMEDTRHTHGLQISLVSKVAHFLHPTKVLPFDSFAKDGRNNALDAYSQPRIKGGSNYEKHVQAWRIIRDDKDFKQAISAAYIELGDAQRPKDENVFAMRILDLYLMAMGGRFDPRLSFFDGKQIEQTEINYQFTPIPCAEDTPNCGCRVP